MAGCASMKLVSLESDTVDGPKQVRQGQDINPRDITVWGIYKDGSRKVVSVGASDITFNKHSPGPQTVKVRIGVFNSQEVSFQTEVMALTTLTVLSPPRTTLFKIGEEPDPAWPGLVIQGGWDRMGNHNVDIKSCEITGFMINQPGKQTLTVAFEGLTTNFDIDVRAMTAIQITQSPEKLNYIQGEPLELTGIKAVGIWEGFPNEDLIITMADVSGFNPNNAGVQRVVVTQRGRSASFDVEVLALSRLVLEKPPTKTIYKFGEELDLTGIMIFGHYTGADPTKSRTEVIPINELSVDGFDPNRIGNQQRVTITVRGITVNFFVDIVLP
jgi:hypothetical protein